MHDEWWIELFGLGSREEENKATSIISNLQHCQMAMVMAMTSSLMLSTTCSFSFPSITICISSYNPNPSRRLALFHLLSGPFSIPQSQSLLFGVKGSELFRVAEANVAKNLIQPEQNLFEWVKNDNRRFLHVVFYTECLGMKLLRKRDIPEERYTNPFLGYGPEDSNFTVELTYNYGVDKYDIGNGFGHLGVVVEDAAKAVDLIKAKGGKVIKEPGPVKGGSTVTSCIQDPDGDLDRAIIFYQKAIGMQLLRRKDNPEHKNTVATMGYGPEDKNTVLELTYIYGITNYDKGNGYGQIEIGTNDVYKSAEAIKLCGGKIIREPGPLPGINTKIAVCLDPDGWKLAFVDNADFLKELE
ncbi:putative lactoylglutathione lyase [Arachis hypogaea]|nr:putative lactoylglutathione lyase [Arachis hypogaea]